MRAYEIGESASAGATASGGIAPVASPWAWYQDLEVPCCQVNM
jgi:hypothetical protein